MSKTRIVLAGSALLGLTALPAVMIPASAASTPSAARTGSTSGGQAGVSNSSSGPLLSVCVTVTPKSVGVGINGQNIVIGPAGVPRSCVEIPPPSS